MPKVKYQDLTLSRKTHATIEQANEIIAEYAAQGFDLTLRQLYYQFVARGFIANLQKSYKALGEAINSGRLAGLIDWDAITDRTRNLRTWSYWTTPQERIKSVAHGFTMDLWKTQEYRVEIWIEKDALLGVLDSCCPALRVPYFSCRGYVSQSEMWSAAMRLKRYEKDGKKTVILHLGDHDPSGVDMSRDIADRLKMFGAKTNVMRIALSMDQVEEFQPPPNPAKTTDSRYADYIAAWGEESWELDALSPPVLAALIEGTVSSMRDERKWAKAVAKEEAGQAEITRVANAWPDVIHYLDDTIDDCELDPDEPD